MVWTDRWSYHKTAQFSELTPSKMRRPKKQKKTNRAKMMMKKFSALCRPSPLHPEDSSLEQCCSRQVCNFLLQVFDRWWLDRVTFFNVSTWVLLSIMEPPWFNRLVDQLVIFLIFKPTWSPSLWAHYEIIVKSNIKLEIHNFVLQFHFSCEG